MRIRIGSLTVAAILTVAIFYAVPAGAVPMTQGTIVDVTFPAPGGNPNLAASATVTLTSLTTTSATFDTIVSNNTLVDPTADITAFGFLMSPTPTANSNVAVTHVSGTSAFVKVTTPDNIPSINAENVCAWTGNNCSGGANTGLDPGQSEHFQFALAGSFNTTSGVDLSTFGIKWQDCVSCSFEIVGTPTVRHRTPEPASVTLIGGGLLVLFLVGKFRRAARP